MSEQVTVSNLGYKPTWCLPSHGLVYLWKNKTSIFLFIILRSFSNRHDSHSDLPLSISLHTTSVSNVPGFFLRTAGKIGTVETYLPGWPLKYISTQRLEWSLPGMLKKTPFNLPELSLVIPWLLRRTRSRIPTLKNRPFIYYAVLHTLQGIQYTFLPNS